MSSPQMSAVLKMRNPTIFLSHLDSHTPLQSDREGSGYGREKVRHTPPHLGVPGERCLKQRGKSSEGKTLPPLYTQIDYGNRRKTRQKKAGNPVFALISLSLDRYGQSRGCIWSVKGNCYTNQDMLKY